MAVVQRAHRRFRGMALLLALFGFLLSASTAQGVAVDGLYRAAVPVAGDEESQIDAGYRRGLEQVLIRVSGDRDVLAREGMTAKLDNIEPLLSSWQVEEGPAGEELLQMAFSPRAVNGLLADVGSRVWGANRPLTLAWIAVQDGGDRGLLVETGESSEQGWSALIQDQARQRGLPLALPPANRTADRRLLSDVWGQFMGQIARASSGIEHDLLAVVRISQRNGSWQASWLYQGRGIDQSQSVSADSQEALAAAMIDAWVGELASQFAVTGGRIETGPYVRLVVEGVSSPADYAAIKQSLARLNPVESVGAVSVSPGRIVFRVEHVGEVAQLQQNIALDDRFRPLTGASESAPEAGAGNTAPMLFYRWQGSSVAPSKTEDR